mmetsp:Transcript_36401/g.95730  ORF Transcript_36401/g.95730 Transcript_36401/m.95730 type:complete len:234 (-) Transcript_36401:1806-2507(-)
MVLLGPHAVGDEDSINVLAAGHEAAVEGRRHLVHGAEAVLHTLFEAPGDDFRERRRDEGPLLLGGHVAHVWRLGVQVPRHVDRRRDGRGAVEGELARDEVEERGRERPDVGREADLVRADEALGGSVCWGACELNRRQSHHARRGSFAVAVLVLGLRDPDGRSEVNKLVGREEPIGHLPFRGGPRAVPSLRCTTGVLFRARPSPGELGADSLDEFCNQGLLLTRSRLHRVNSR